MYNLNKIKRNIFATAIILFLTVSASLLAGGRNEVEERAVEAEVPIIMYHSILSDKSMHNEYTISPEQFESDIKYLTENGYYTVTVKDLKEFVFADKPLPEKCIMLTFDDGYYNNYYYAYPLLKKYNCKAVISPIASVSESYTKTGIVSVTYGNISEGDIKDMVSSGIVEIQNHSYDMHKLTPRRGIERKIEESEADYKKAASSDIMAAQAYLEKVTGKRPECFVYPFGAKSDSTLDIIKELGFICTMTCTEKNNIITQNPESLFELGRFRRDADETMEHLLKRIIS